MLLRDSIVAAFQNLRKFIPATTTVSLLQPAMAYLSPRLPLLSLELFALYLYPVVESDLLAFEFEPLPVQLQ